MNRDWKFAVSSAKTAPRTAPILLHGEIWDNLKKASDLGYDGLEVHMRENQPINYTRILEAIENTGVKLSSIVTGRLNTEGKVNLMDDRPHITDAAVEGMLAYIDIAQKLDTNLILGWVRGNVPAYADRDHHMNILGRNMQLICNEAQKKGVNIFVEVINRYEINVFNTAEETLDFIKKWQLPNCYIHLDTFHMGIDEIDPVRAIKLCDGYLGYFHVADNTRTYPGLGTFKFDEYLQALDEINYTGYISVECLPIPDGETAARRGLEHLMKCIPQGQLTI